MGISILKVWCGGDFFEFRYHAYVELTYYFRMFVMLNVVLSVMTFFCTDTAMPAGMNTDDQANCQMINTCLNNFCIISGIEAVISILCGSTLTSMMRSKRWASCGLFALGMYLTVLFLKAILIVLGVIWIWGNTANVCAEQVPALHEASQMYLIVYVTTYGLQLTCGSLYLMGCGLRDAVQEALDQFKPQWEDFMDTDDADHMAKDKLLDRHPVEKA